MGFSDAIKNIFSDDSRYSYITRVFFSFFAIISAALSVSFTMTDQYPIAFECVVAPLFLIEYIGRIISSKRKLSYLFGFFGILDFVSFLGMPILLVANAIDSSFLTRIFVGISVFRACKVLRFSQEWVVLLEVLKEKFSLIFRFFVGVFFMALIFSVLMYLAEYPNPPFHTLPSSLYWSFITLSTAGFKSILPQTIMGRIIHSFLAVSSLSLIAVPSAIVAVSMSATLAEKKSRRVCRLCGFALHDLDAKYCKKCGWKL